MPDAWTHILAAREVMKELPYSDYKKSLEENSALFHFGAQGPDLFYYYPFWSWKKHKEMKKTGDVLHRKETRKFLMEAIKYLKEHKEKKEFCLLFSYIAGFITHYAIDTVCHPFIYYFGGVYEPTDPTTQKYDAYHKKYETIIDTLLLEEKWGMKSHKTPVSIQINAGKNLPHIIKEWYVNKVKEIYKIDIETKVIQQCYKQMHFVSKILNDPWGIKRAFLSFCESMKGRKLKTKYAIYPKKITPKLDYLNKKHNPWRYPCNGDEIFHKDFLTLYEEGKKKAHTMLLACIDFLEGRKALLEVEEVIPNLSYDTGKSVNEMCKTYSFQCIFET